MNSSTRTLRTALHAKHVLRITGAGNSGKSARLAELVRQALDGGTDAQDILVVSPSHACGNSEFRQTLHRTWALSQAFPFEVTIVSAHDLACSILDDEGVCQAPDAHARQAPRILEPYEEQFLAEDLRTTGLPRKQLRNVFDFIIANFANLGDWNPEWIEMREERAVLEALERNLEFMGGLLAVQAPNLAAHALATNEELRVRWARKHVFVDDYGLLSRSAQILCNLLARETITVTGELGFSTTAWDPHPNPAGLDEFLELYDDQIDHRLNSSVRVEELPAVDRAVLTREMRMQSVKGEFEAIGELVQEALSQSRTVGIACPNGTWQRNMARFLSGMGIDVDIAQKPIRIRTFDDAGSIASARAATLSKLSVNPSDGVALRCLLGFGDALAGSARIKQLQTRYPTMTLAEIFQSDTSLRELLDNALKEAQSRDEGQRADANATGKNRGENVGKTRNTVAICAPDDLPGKRFDLVIFGGFVAGWTPARAYFDAVGARKEQLRENALRSIDYARRAALEKLVFTSFLECDLEFAERLGLHYERIRLVDGVHMCQLLEGRAIWGDSPNGPTE